MVLLRAAEHFGMLALLLHARGHALTHKHTYSYAFILASTHTRTHYEVLALEVMHIRTRSH